MKIIKLFAIVLIAAGILGLIYGAFSFTRETHEAKVGALEFEIKEKETVNIPVWLSVGGIAVGTALLLTTSKR